MAARRPQTVQLTATPDPGCRFKQWRIMPQGADMSEWYVIDEPNPVLEFQRPVTARATFVHTYGLQVNTRGNGSVSIQPEKEVYEAGETVVLSAQGDPGWAFDHWTGDIMGMMAYDASAQVWMIENRSITAVFIERPGLTEVDFIGDLEYFLLDIGVEEDISTFDWNEIEYDADVERVYVGNGIPDVAELCLVEGVLDRRSLDHSFRSGVYHDFIWDIWNVNLAQAAVDLAGEDPRIQRVVAGYMTLGDYKSEGFIDKLVTIHYNSEGLNTAAYESNGQRYLYYKADADNDGVLNYMEWEWASPNNSIANIPAFVEAALDGVEPDEGEQSAFVDSPVDLFAPEMDEVFAALDRTATRSVTLSLDGAQFQFGGTGSIGLGGVSVNSAEPYSSIGTITLEVTLNGCNYEVGTDAVIDLTLHDVFDFDYFTPQNFDESRSAAMIQSGFGKTGSVANAGQVGLVEVEVHGDVKITERTITP